METMMMKKTVRGKERSSEKKEEEETVRKGPWTMEEDLILFNYIVNHGEGLWNSAAKSSGLKRTGKSCRLRWLNYLRPDVRRGNITEQEQLLIIQLHAKLGNKWSKIAKHLPGRTDNEIKNFWRTKIQKHIKVSSSSSSSFENLITQSSEMMMTTTDQGSYHMVETETFSPATTTTTTTTTTSFHELDESNENYWNVDDLWPLQFA